MKKLFKELRFLRSFMGVVTLFCVVMSRFAGGETLYSGWGMVPTLIVPAIVPILFFVIWLDVLMSWVFRIDAEGEEKARLGRVMIFDLIMVSLLTLSWVGFFLSLAD